jgi:hypothetical protein
MTEANVPVKLSELRDAFDYVSMGMELEARAYIGLDIGQVYLHGDGMPEAEGTPEEVEESGRFVPVPDKYDLDLGKPLCSSSSTATCRMTRIALTTSSAAAAPTAVSRTCWPGAASLNDC